MWIVVYLVKGRDAMLNIRHMLESEGIIVMIRKKTTDDDTQAFYDILVPQTEAEKAQGIIITNESEKK